MKLTINVTQDNIDKSERSSKCNCPIARAVKSLFVNEHGASQDLSIASIDHDGGRMMYKVKIEEDGESKWAEKHYKFSLPDAAQAFIRNRDENKKFVAEPFSFTIEAKQYKPKQYGE